MFHNILVALDGSAHGETALQLATSLAQHNNAHLGILSAYPHVTGVFGSPNYEELLTARISSSEALLEAARQSVPSEVEVITHLLEGPAAPAILRVAETEHYDLIVVGSRGLGQLRGLLLGSVSSVVAQRARCHVLIAHGLTEQSTDSERTLVDALMHS